MATSSDAKGFKQDMVVSIRYRNDLPPPPMPPKLLDIDTGGLAQYLTTSYASALAKREEPNIEIDAEGGMPIDMVGVPGYFLGDESAIMAPDVPPMLDPADQMLMISADQLKSQGAKGNVSFLRRTQYMTSQNARANDPMLRTNAKMRKPTDASKTGTAVLAKDDKENIKRHIQKGFDIAYPDSIPFNPSEAKSHSSTAQDRDAWRNPVHPDNPRLKPVSFHPIIPDLDAVTDMSGNWHSVKFEKPPLGTIRGQRDDRIDAGWLTASANEAKHSTWKAKRDAFEKNPDLYDDPGQEPYLWSLSVPKTADAVSKIKRMFNDGDPDKDNQGIRQALLEESADGSMRVPFERVKVYSSVSQQGVDSRRFMAMTLIDTNALPAKSRFRKQGSAAYYYPILERVRFRTDRGKVGKSQASQPEINPESNLADQLMILPREPTLTELEVRMGFRGDYDKAYAEEYARIVRDNKIEQEALKAQEILDEQGSLHDGAQDVSMAEIQAAEQMEIRGSDMNGPTSSRKERDRDSSGNDVPQRPRADDEEEDDADADMDDD